MLLIGLTGGIASGKTTVTTYLKDKYHVKILDADEIVRELSKVDAPIWRLFVEHFGRCILQADETLCREKIAAIVFQKTHERQWLDQNTHPLVKNEFLKQIAQYKEAGEKILILDIPLLFEAHWEDMVDRIWVINVSRDVQEERLMKRNALDLHKAQARIDAQMPLPEKCTLADAVIDNSASPLETYRQIDALWDEYTKAGEY